ncbi:hypothetical protein [Streptomyces sp. NPDC013457]|uniref:hypothetical protein n=1 Tax=Streptomyces sp. NPDC013457 TaxID=3364866 RepID=UPI003701906E
MTTEEAEKSTFFVEFEGINLTDEQKSKVEDTIVTSIQHVLTSMQLEKALEVLKSSDILVPEGLGEGERPPKRMGAKARPPQ